MATIEAVDLGRRYGGKWGLRKASFTVEEGCIAILLGPNGAGKTTTIKILTTLLKPSVGYASVLGYDVVDGYKMIRRRIAYLPQDCSVDRNWTPMEAIKWFLVARGFSISNAHEEAVYWLRETGLWDVRNTTVWRLSGGMARRVLVAMVLATDADLIFLDEPTTGLDVESRYAVWRILRELVGMGKTILLTTHDMKEAEMIADEVIMIGDGETLMSGDPRSMLASSLYKYRVVVEDVEGSFDGGFEFLDLGDRKILYARDMDDATNILEMLSVNGSVKIERVGLEDIYFHIIRGVWDGV